MEAMLCPMTDADLISAVQAGEPDAFEFLVQRHQRALVDLFYRLSRDHDTAEDCAQEVFAKLASHLGTFEPRAKFTTFLHRVARNLWIDKLRAGAGRHSISLDAASGDGDGTLHDSVPAASTGPLETLERQELVELLRRAVMALPDGLRKVVILAEQHGLGYNEVGALLRIPVGTVKSRIHAARERLRQMLSGPEVLAAACA